MGIGAAPLSTVSAMCGMHGTPSTPRQAYDLPQAAARFNASMKTRTFCCWCADAGNTACTLAIGVAYLWQQAQQAAALNVGEHRKIGQQRHGRGAAGVHGI